ncbi:MAG TPA: DUF6065 family protein [Tepidisphaeraceae bacterium]|nr:DUF6065 family protein [Tepidisphaeraceae bacterium]
MPRIAFHTPADVFDQIPHPYPAIRHVPDWFKQMPMDYEDGAMLKRCPPFLAAMTAGYIIPLPADLGLEIDAAGQLKISSSLPIISSHFPAQYKGSPFQNRPVLKLRNPWIIETPPEYACLIMAPVNRFETPLVALSGIVETGSYYKEVHLPVVCMLEPGQRFAAKAGTPIVQVIPIRREDWTSEAGFIDEPRRAQQQALFDSTPHAYKEQFWRKLEFE